MHHAMIIVMLLDSLFEAEHRRYNAAVTRLVEQNCEMRQVTTPCFMFNGQLYLASGNPMPAPGGRPYLHPSLTEEGNWVESIMRDMENARSQIRMVLAKLIGPCTEPRDVRNALPECLVGFVENGALLEHPRTNEPAYTLEGDPRAMKQYLKVLPKMEQYACGHLIY